MSGAFILPAFWIGAGVALFTSIQATIVGFLGHRRRLYLAFALVCLCDFGMLCATAIYYSASDVSSGGNALRWQIAFMLAGVPFLYAFISLYTGMKTVPAFASVLAYFGLLSAINLASPYSLRFESLHRAAPARLPWGEILAHFTGDLSPWRMPLRAGVIAVLLFALARTVVQYRRGQRGAAILFGSYLVLQLMSVPWSILVDRGRVMSIYFGGLTFLILTFLMTVKLGYDIRDGNREIRRQASDWKETFDGVRTPMFVTDSSGRIVQANRAACELAGRAEDSIAETPIDSLGDAEPWQTALQLVQHMAEDRGSTYAESRDDHGRTWEITVSQFSSASESEPRCILVFWETTNVVELQESLRRRERITSMGTLVAGVAHEVRNPLFGISATLDAYETELEGFELSGFANVLRGEVRRLIRLMQELLDFGKPAALKIEKVNVAEVIHDAIESFGKRTSKVRVVSDVPPTLPALLLDRSRLRQVFENLIENAAQHSPEGSLVYVEASPVEHAGRQWVECLVDDSGPGFIAQDFERVFEPFYSRREGGTGLGLSIVQRIVEEHAGIVVAGNRADGGASVRVRLPVAPAPA